jgi:hypothetical protein
MREQTVEADRHADHGKDVHGREQYEIDPAESPPPEQDSGDCEPTKRDGDPGEGSEPGE